MAKCKLETKGDLDIDDILQDIVNNAGVQIQGIKPKETPKLTIDECIIAAMEQALLECQRDAKSKPSPPADVVWTIDCTVDDKGKKHWKKTYHKHQPNYMDTTGNLRSSIGYQIYQNGQFVTEVFGGESAGVKAGKETAKEASAESSESIVGFLVAGMPYALAVESKGYDVLTGSVKDLKSKFEKYLKIQLAKKNG